MFTISSVQIEGIKGGLQTEKLNTVLPREGEEYTIHRGQQIIRELYALGLFHDVQLFRNGDDLIVRVTENSVINTFDVQGGASLIRKADLLEALSGIGVEAGATFDLYTFFEVDQALTHEYASLGYPDIEVDLMINTIGDGKVDVQLRIREGGFTNWHYVSEVLGISFRISEEPPRSPSRDLPQSTFQVDAFSSRGVDVSVSYFVGGALADESELVSFQQSWLDAAQKYGIELVKNIELINLKNQKALLIESSININDIRVVDLLVMREPVGVAIKLVAPKQEADTLQKVLREVTDTIEFIGGPVDLDLGKTEVFNQEFLGEWRDALDGIYQNHNWNFQNIRFIYKQLQSEGLLLEDFEKPKTELSVFVLKNQSPEWIAFLNVFAPPNLMHLSFPGQIENLLREAGGESKLSNLESIKHIRNTTVTKRQWRTLTFQVNQIVNLNLHTDSGSSLTAADILAEFLTLNDKKYGSKGTLKRINAFIDFYLDVDVHVNLSEFVSARPTSDQEIVCLLGILALNQVVSALAETKSYLPTRNLDPVTLEIYIYRELASFRTARKELLLSDPNVEMRSFAIETEHGVDIHVVAEEDDLLVNTEATHLGIRELLDFMAKGIETLDGQDHEDEGVELSVWDRVSVLFLKLTHELDHAVLNLHLPGRPRWFLEGHAATITAYHEILGEVKQGAMAGKNIELRRESKIAFDEFRDFYLGFKEQDQINLNILPSDSQKRTLLKTMANLESELTRDWVNMRIFSKKERFYLKTLANSSALQTDLKRVILTPNSEFGTFQDESLQYALAWAIFRTVITHSMNSTHDWNAHKKIWWKICLSTQAELRDLLFSGAIDEFVAWVASDIRKPEITHEQLKPAVKRN